MVLHGPPCHWDCPLWLLIPHERPLQALHSMLERELWKKLPMIPGGLPSLTDAVEGPHSPPALGQIGAALGSPQLSSSSAFEQWAAQGNPWRAGPGQRCVLAMLGLARGAAHMAGAKAGLAACQGHVQRRAALCMRQWGIQTGAALHNYH